MCIKLIKKDFTIENGERDTQFVTQTDKSKDIRDTETR